MWLDHGMWEESKINYLTVHSILINKIYINIYCRWLELILIEFYAQGDAERIAQIPVTPMMDRNSNVPVPKFQVRLLL